MDERLIALNDKVASAAEAWLTDPKDVRAYERLVSAVRERRAYLQPTLDVLPPARSAGRNRPPPGENTPAVPSPITARCSP